MRIFLVLLFFSFHLLWSADCSSRNFSENSFEPWGYDKELILEKKNEKLSPSPHTSIASNIGQGMIRFFQKKISPIDGARSSFYPTSSQYTLLAIKKYGLLQGIALGCDRLLRENGETWIYETTNRFAMPRKLDPLR